MRSQAPGPQRATRIRATCLTCGEVELGVADVTLTALVGAEHGFYSFLCPLCTEVVTKPADQRVIGLLIGGGVPLRTYQAPLEFLEEHTGPPLTHDDLLDLHNALESPSFWADIQAPRTPLG